MNNWESPSLADLENEMRILFLGVSNFHTEMLPHADNEMLKSLMHRWAHEAGKYRTKLIESMISELSKPITDNEKENMSR